MHFLLCILHNIVSLTLFPPFNLPFVFKSLSLHACVLFLFIFWLAGLSLVAVVNYSFIVLRGLPHHGGFSCCEALGTWTSLVAAHRLKSMGSVGAREARLLHDLEESSGLGIKAMSLALAGRFLSWEIPSCVLLNHFNYMYAFKVISDCFWNVMGTQTLLCDLNHTLVLLSPRDQKFLSLSLWLDS